MLTAVVRRVLPLVFVRERKQVEESYSTEMRPGLSKVTTDKEQQLPLLTTIFCVRQCHFSAHQSSFGQSRYTT